MSDSVPNNVPSVELGCWYAHDDRGPVYVIRAYSIEDARQRFIEAAPADYRGTDLRPHNGPGVITFNPGPRSE